MKRRATLSVVRVRSSGRWERSMSTAVSEKSSRRYAHARGGGTRSTPRATRWFAKATTAVCPLADSFRLHASGDTSQCRSSHARRGPRSSSSSPLLRSSTRFASGTSNRRMSRWCSAGAGARSCRAASRPSASLPTPSCSASSSRGLQGAGAPKRSSRPRSATCQSSRPHTAGRRGTSAIQSGKRKATPRCSPSSMYEMVWRRGSRRSSRQDTTEPAAPSWALP
mmetsp:Transcript_93613/g.265056  ORF Transcript_93613/g.265056 Transcript_93613/m.265056 type:complete len:224 (+) Transcript_93613:281-952(+)